MDTPADVILHLAHAGVSLVVDARLGRLPSIVHWGAQLGNLGDEALVGLSDAAVPVVGSNNVDTAAPRRGSARAPHRLDGPARALAARHAGRGWSPALHHDRDRRSTAPRSTAWSSAGRVARSSHAADDAQPLALRLELELLPSGLIRGAGRADERPRMPRTRSTRCSVGSRSPPRRARCWTSPGRHNYERFPQRGPLARRHPPSREPQGRTAADSAYVLHAGSARFRVRRGPRSGPCTPRGAATTRHYAERVYTGEQVLGGGEVLLPGEMRLASRRELSRVRGSTERTVTGSTRSPHRFHRHLRALGADRPRSAQ